MDGRPRAVSLPRESQAGFPVWISRFGHEYRANKINLHLKPSACCTMVHSWEYSWGETIEATEVESEVGMEVYRPNSKYLFLVLLCVRSRLRKQQPRFRCHDSPEWSMHNPTCLSMSSPAVMVNAQPSLYFDLVTRRNGEFTIQPLFRSRDSSEW